MCKNVNNLHDALTQNKSEVQGKSGQFGKSSEFYISSLIFTKSKAEFCVAAESVVPSNIPFVALLNKILSYLEEKLNFYTPS